MLQLFKTRPVMSDALIGKTLARFQEQPGWAVHLPDDPTTYHVGTSPKAREFQEIIAATRPFGGWSASHMCLKQVIHRFRTCLPRRYLEIGVNEGLSILAMVTCIRLNRALAQKDPLQPIFDELVLADIWGNQFGGTGRGSHQHVDNLLRSVCVDPATITFLDGDSKKVVPAYLKARTCKEPFDAVYVDGDHSYVGAKTDLENTLPYVGKILFFDDMYHPAHCTRDQLLNLHRSMVERLKRDFYVFVNRHWFGFAAFVRKDVFETLS
jgi:hypothetical protein